MYRFFTVFVLGIFWFQADLSAQDPRFSQYYANPSRINPALTGVFDGQVRLQALYREQFTSVAGPEAYKLAAASFEMRLPVGRFDQMGIGLDFLRDEAGTSNFQRLHANLGMTYIKQLSGSRGSDNAQYLSGGAQIGFGQWSFEANRLWFSSQFDPGTISVNEGQNSGEDFEGQEYRLHMSINAGLLWYALLDENASVYAGAGLYHANNPNIAFANDYFQPLDRRWVAHIGGEVPLNDDLSLLPAVIYMQQGPATSTTLGTQLKYYGRNLSDLDMKLGLWLHAGQSPTSSFQLESIILSTVLEMPSLSLGLSYDFTGSPLTLVNEGRGALEINIAYKYLQERGRSYRVNCPSF
jgi:type IX secretion system PorP/SprF family membrane protein